MELTIVTPIQTTMIDITWLEIETYKGNLVIQSGHAPSYIVLKPKTNVQWLASSGQTESMFIGHGFLEVNREKLMLIADRQESTTGS